MIRLRRTLCGRQTTVKFSHGRDGHATKPAWHGRLARA